MASATPMEIVDRASTLLIANERTDRLALMLRSSWARPRGDREEDRGRGCRAGDRSRTSGGRLGANSEHALELIDRIVREAAYPVIVLLHEPDPGFVKEASKRRVFAPISDDDVEDWQGSIEIVLRRFAEFHDLQGAFGRALTERAKGVLMERHSIDGHSAFELLRQHSRFENRKLIDLAQPSSTPTASY